MHRNRSASPLLSGLLAACLAAPVLAQTDYHEQPVLFQWGRYIALKSQGYRMTSLDVAGDLGNHRWAACWEKKSGPDWQANFGISGVDLSLWQYDLIKQGYRVAWITSAGSGLNRVYGCIMVKDGLEEMHFNDLMASQFDTMCNSAHELGYLLASASTHGTAAEPRFALVFVENPAKTRWGVRRGDTAAEYQTTFNTFVGQVDARPAIVTMSASQEYLSVFHDDEIGSWVARHGMTAAGYESQKTTLGASGYRPYQIMFEGTGSATRYAALFVKGSPASRLMTTTGTAVPALAAIDTIMTGATGFMRDRNAIAASVAVAKDGRLIFARGYTHAPSGYVLTQPTTGFRIASCSKPLTAIATYQLAERRSDFTLSSKLANLVPLGAPKDSRASSITLRQLMDHTSGYNAWWGDGCTNKLTAAKSSWANNDLAFAPGTQEAYSNGGYMMLGLMIETMTGLSYRNYVQQNVFGPLGVTRAHLITSGHQAGDAFCHFAGWGGSKLLGIWNSAVHSGNPLVNGAYSISPLAIDASGGLVFSTVDMVRVLSGVFDRNVVLPTSILTAGGRDALESIIEMPGRTGGWDGSANKMVGSTPYTYYKKGGLWRSAHTYIARRSDGISIAAFCSGPGAPPIDDINAAIDAAYASLPGHDLFPSYGLPAFPKKILGIVKPFGIGCTGSNGQVVHSASGTPEIAKVQTFHLSNGPKSSAAILQLGFSAKVWGPIPLPFDLTPFGAPGCRLYASPDVSFVVPTNADGAATFGLTHGSARQFIGLHVYTQFVCLDKANRLGLTYSNGVETQLGGM